MGQAGSMIANGMNLTLGLSKALLTGVTPEIFARRATVGGHQIDAVHPAFVYGHLAIYPARCLAMLGQDPQDTTPSERFVEVFSPTAQCQDDPDGTIYPGMEEITALYFRGHERLQGALAEAGDDVLARELPDEARRERFPTIGCAIDFLAGGHAMLHLGQVSTWRRCMGLGSAM